MGNHRLTDIHSAIVVVSVLFGCLAQFWFVFPDDFWGILFSIAGYGVCTFAANCVEWFATGGDAFILDLEDADDETLNAFCVGIKSELPEWTWKWTVTWTSRVHRACKYEAVMDIRQFFDVNGEFVRRTFNKELQNHWIAFARQFNRN